MVDKTTYEEAAQALFPTLYRICMSILHSSADAQDAVQQALMKAWVHRGKIQPEKLRAWITRVLINECRDIQRHRMRVTPVEEMMDAAAPYIPPDSDLLEAVDALPEALRIPFVLKYSESYTEKEIAETLRLSIPAVKNRLFRARKTLQKSLNAEVTFE